MEESGNVNAAANTGADANGSSGTQPGAAAGAQGQQNQQNQDRQMFTQSDIDKRVAQAMKAFREKELPGILDGARAEGATEAERLAKMNAEQKADHQRQKAEEAFKKREADLAGRERAVIRAQMRGSVIEELGEKSLPVSLHKLVNYESADTVRESVDMLESEFRKAVEEGVNARLKAGAPPKNPAPGDEDPFLTGLNRQR